MSGSDWLLDLGNTRLKCAPMTADGSIGSIAAIAYDEDDWGAVLPDEGRVAYLASVAPAGLAADLLEALTARFERISIARTQPVFAGVRIAYPRPERLGVDRFLALLGAHARGDGPWLLVSVGTALTLDLLAVDGTHLGGRIMPSPALMRAALHARAGHLPAAGGDYVEFAVDTADALASGCDGAALALVERSMRQAGDLLGVAPTVLLHGGGSGWLATRLPEASQSPELVLEGLAAWARIETGG